MIVLVPYFGDLARFRPVLDKWFASFRGVFPSPDVAPVLLTDAESSADVERAALELGAPGSIGVEAFDLAGFADLIRPGQPFDRKGALVCSWLLEHDYPTLVLDADAFLARDPRPLLEEFVDAPIAMPVDHGALINDRSARLEAPFGGVVKLCAGVQFFGFARGGRSRLVAGYRRAFEEIVALPRLPWSPPLSHLVEQYAWSVASSRRGGLILPVAMNWAPGHLGPNPSAVVNHHFGRRKPA